MPSHQGKKTGRIVCPWTPLPSKEKSKQKEIDGLHLVPSPTAGENRKTRESNPGLTGSTYVKMYLAESVA